MQRGQVAIRCGYAVTIAYRSTAGKDGDRHLHTVSTVVDPWKDPASSAVRDAVAEEAADCLLYTGYSAVGRNVQDRFVGVGDFAGDEVVDPRELGARLPVEG